MQQVSAFRKAGRLAWRIAAKGKHMLLPNKDYVLYRGSVLPRPESRLNGTDQKDDACFLDSSIKEAARVSGLDAQQPSLISDAARVAFQSGSSVNSAAFAIWGSMFRKDASSGARPILGCGTPHTGFNISM
jgi:hypothetical protein